MDNLAIAAFITGLTAGGLSCFAVQGGLLSASIAQRLETDAKTPVQPAAPERKQKSKANPTGAVKTAASGSRQIRRRRPCRVK